ncbi:MAG: spermidine synthase [Stellaceae bacterium]
MRERIVEQYGTGCRIQQLRRTPRFRSSLFVVDLTEGARITRILGAIGENGQLTEQSGMDLLHPERLIFHYERLMLIALALAARPGTALLLGLGGGAMLRHLRAYLPDCAVTVVERDRAVIELARRFFHITAPVVEADAQDFVADRRGAYDVILADLYDGRGMASFEPGFWRDCAAALTQGGCIAVNWAAFVDDQLARAEATAIEAAVGRSLFTGPRALRENVVQLAPLDPGIALAELAPRWRRFALRHRLPREDREALKRCTVTARFLQT